MFPARFESQISADHHSCFANIPMFVEFVAVATAAAVHSRLRSYLVPRVRTLKIKVASMLKPVHQWSQRRCCLPTTAEVAAAIVSPTFVIAVLNIINSEKS